MIPRYPVYLFDVDGTLVDSAPDICAAQSEVLAAAGRNGVTFEQLRNYVGLELRAVFGNMLPECSEADMQKLMQEYTLNYRGRKNSGTRVYPGVREALANIKGQRTTATTKSTKGTRLVLEHFGLLSFFDHVQGTDGFPCKPAPDVIVAALAALGADREQCLMVGDSPADMEAGRRAGVKICAVRYGYGDPARLATWEPDHWISDLRELVE